MSWDGSERRTENWHLKKELSYGHIMTTLMLAAGLVGVYTDMNNGIDANKAEIQHVKEIHQVHTKQYNRSIDDIKENMNKTFDKIDAKLDKLIESQHTHE